MKTRTKTIIEIILLIIFWAALLNAIFCSKIYAYQQSHERDYNWNKYLKTIQFRYHFRNLVKTLKIEEGFRPKRYSDHGYDCIGFGQRTKFYPDIIQDSINIKQADLILKKSLWRHLKLVKRIYPQLRGKRLLYATKTSYQKGIKKVRI